MLRRETNGHRMIADPWIADDAPLVDDVTQKTGSNRQRPNPASLLGRKTGGEKMGDPLLGVEQPKCRVLRVQQCSAGLDDFLQQLVERKFAGQRDLAKGGEMLPQGSI